MASIKIRESLINFDSFTIYWFRLPGLLKELPWTNEYSSTSKIKRAKKKEILIILKSE